MKLSERLLKDYDNSFLLAPSRKTIAEVKELEEKAEAFDWFALHGDDYEMDFCLDLGWRLQHLVYTDQVFEGQSFLECVRKARGEE